MTACITPETTMSFLIQTSIVNVLRGKYNIKPRWARSEMDPPINSNDLKTLPEAMKKEVSMGTSREKV